MARKLFGHGLRGEIAERIQTALAAAGFSPGSIDGYYWNDTVKALRAFQRAANLPETGDVDERTWLALIKNPAPRIAERALGLTAAIEGHGYSLALGNWDRAWLTWGIIGFTLRHGEVQKIVIEIQQHTPQILRQSFGDRLEELLSVMRADSNEQQLWADSITSGHGLAEPWRTGFARLGAFPEVRDIQRRRAFDDYFTPALATARRISLKSELGIALCFDIHVQNGGVRDKAQNALASERARRPGMTEEELRCTLANAVANTSIERYREDVRARKLAIATGRGTVHGLRLELENWGLSGAFEANTA